MSNDLHEVLSLAGGSLKLEGTSVAVVNAALLRDSVEKLVELSAVGAAGAAGWARYIVRGAALELGIIPASIHDLYLARGRGDVPLTFTVPAINLRALSFHAARAVLRAAASMNAGALIFEIARSEIGYTGQRPAEYATNVLAAAIAEEYAGPIFIQGDHFQISAKKYAADSEKEVQAVQSLALEALAAGFYNIDIDASTLVDLSKESIKGQQRTNFEVSARLSALIRQHQPPNVTVSIGGEIGEVGGRNSTEPELRAYMDGYLGAMQSLAPGAAGLSKISIQTGTSHGGTVLADGTLARVDVDFGTLRHLSRVARSAFHLGGAVQHGASTLPEEAFGKFVESEAVEVHLATNFMTMFYDRIPDDLRREMYDWLGVQLASERKAGMTDEQFFYKTRKNALGAFKAQAYGLPESVKADLGTAWEAQFTKLFRFLGLPDTRPYVNRHVEAVAVTPRVADYVQDAGTAEDVSDLSD